jgi:hypothetical protein
MPWNARSRPNGRKPADLGATRHPREGQLEVPGGWVAPELGPLDDEHAVRTRQLAVLEPERLERRVADRPVFAETKQIDVNQFDRPWMDHADRVGRAAYTLGSRNREPARECSHERGLAGSHLAAQQHDVATAQAGAERLGPAAHAWLVEFEFLDGQIVALMIDASLRAVALQTFGCKT